MGDVRDPRQLLDCFSGDGGRESASNETKKHMAGSSSILDYSAFWPILLSCTNPFIVATIRYDTADTQTQ